MPSLPWRSKNFVQGWDKRSSGFVTHVTFLSAFDVHRRDWRALLRRIRLLRLDLSERQAYRYLQEASQLGGPIEVPEGTVPITLKLPPRTVELLRKYARSSGLTIGAIIASALNAFLRALKRHG
jgi:hypothetical protein